jgi:ornithine aminotransferase
MKAIDLENRYSARNYEPLPVVLARGEGAHLWDSAGRRYVDMMSAYSAASHGHAHPRILAALSAQAHRLAVPSRAFYNDRLGAFLAEICRLTGLDAALPMNTGAEAVETAIKAARRWGYRVKGIARDRAEIIVADGNFHGRTTTVISFSSESDYRDGFGPFTPGFRSVPFGDLAAVERAIGPHTAAVLVEPIQGEAGIIVPPAGFLCGLRRLCDANRVLLILDEVQSGLGRTGEWFAYEHEGIRPDGLILGKALGGGVLPVSAFVARREVMDVFTPGSHGSTFGGNPLAAAVGLEALQVIRDEGLVEKSATLGAHMLERLRAFAHPALKDVRGRGLWAGAEIDPQAGSAREVCERLLAKGVLSKETHHTVVRLAPPLVIARRDLDWALDRFEEVLDDIGGTRRRPNTARPKTARPETPRPKEAPPATAKAMLEGAADKQIASRPSGRFLMCRPEHFAVSYVINPWMDPESWDNHAQLAAAGEWRALYVNLVELGASVELLPPAAGLPDLVFTANAGVVLDGHVLLSRFRHAERRREEPHFEAAFKGLQACGLIEGISRLPGDVVLEGAGDCVFDAARGLFWMGYGPRSDAAARHVVADTFGRKVVALRLADERFYHMDTALCPLTGGEVMYLPGAFTRAGRAQIRAHIAPADRIEIGPEDGFRLAANAVCLGKVVIMSGAGKRLAAELAERGYRVIDTPLPSFLRSGGSAFCLTLRLDRQSVAVSARDHAAVA